MDSQPITIHQFHYATGYDDSITRYMQAVRHALGRQQIDGEIFSCSDTTRNRTGVKQFAKRSLWNCDLLLIHHSTYNPSLGQICELELPKVLIYHGIPPPRLLDDSSQGPARRGLRQLQMLEQYVIAAFAFCKVQHDELRHVGFERVELLPRLDLSTTSVEPRSDNPHVHTRLISVGSFSPVHNQRVLIEAMHYLERTAPGIFLLNLVGCEDTLYTEYLTLLTRGLRLERAVRFYKKQSAGHLALMFKHSDIFVYASRYEGFCAELVAAITAGLPIIALDDPGVRETLAGAGVLVQTTRAYKLASYIYAAARDTNMLRQLSLDSIAAFEKLRQTQNFESIHSAVVALVNQLRHQAPTRRPTAPFSFHANP